MTAGRRSTIGKGADIIGRKGVGKKSQLLASIAEDYDDAIVVHDLRGNVILLNRGAERMFGCSEEEMLGKNISTMIPEEKRAEEMEIFSGVVAGKDVKSYESQRLGRNGRKIHVLVAIKPIKDKRGRVKAIATISKDITE